MTSQGERGLKKLCQWPVLRNRVDKLCIKSHLKEMSPEGGNSPKMSINSILVLSANFR